jgi:hypothetical protein
VHARPSGECQKGDYGQAILTNVATYLGRPRPLASVAMWRRALLGAMVVVTALLWPAGAAIADSPGSPPVVKLVGPSPYTVHLKSTNDQFTASFSLSVENDGPELTSSQYSLVTISDHPDQNDVVLKITTPTALQARTDTEVPVSLRIADRTTTTLTVLLTVSANDILPSSQTLTLTRAPLSTNFLGIALASLGLGFAVLVLLTLTLRRRTGRNNILWTPSTFSFSGSWVTSITAVVTAVVAVFTTTGVLTALVPGIDSSAFIGSTVVYAFVLSLAPMIYSALMTADSTVQNGSAFGTRTGYRLAAAITAVAFGGQLATVGAVVSLSSMPLELRTGLMALLGVAAVVMVVYVWRSGDQLSKLTDPSPPATAPTETQPLTMPAGQTTLVVAPAGFLASGGQRPPGLP